jgi:hypothetical protein
MPIIRIISLGEIVTQNQQRALIAFAQLINPGNPNSVIPMLRSMLQSEHFKTILEEFKRGLITQLMFTTTVVQFLKEITGAELAQENFLQAWNTMNPSYDDFYIHLNELFEVCSDDVRMFLVSHSNPIDIAHFVNELKKYHVPYTVDEKTGALNRIKGIPIYLTYTTLKTKAELIQQIVTQERSSQLGEHLYGLSLFKPSGEKSAMDIKYIRSVDGIHDPILRALAAESSAHLDKIMSANLVDTLIWNKKDHQPLNEALHSSITYKTPAVLL